MNKKLLLVGITLVLLMGLQACTTMSLSRQEAASPEKAVMATGGTEPAVTIMVDESGELIFEDKKGENFGLCRFPGTKASNSELPICDVSEKSMKVKGMKAIPILETEGSGCVTLGPDINGHYWQYCW